MFTISEETCDNCKYRNQVKVCLCIESEHYREYMLDGHGCEAQFSSKKEMDFFENGEGILQNRKNTVLKFKNVDQMRERMKLAFQNSSVVTVEKWLDGNTIYLESEGGNKSCFNFDLYYFAKEYSDVLKLSHHPSTKHPCGGVLFSVGEEIVAIAPLDFESVCSKFLELTVIPETIESD